MEYATAFNLLSVSQKKATETAIEDLFKAIGATPDQEMLKQFMVRVSGSTYEELLEEGNKKMSSMVVASAPAPAAEKEEVKEEKKEAVKEEEEEDEDFGLFD
ncbi:hypothetical protein EDEG_01040 [Edhazardia aedis USNM 41457]|uniref:60S acidic ribosomal protein P2 n=1 Tax=Edhazardia aedis (strain USNM 41457) TaxID=1003232 RepID=J9DQC1_EDHAE|nr:hypothetical protein EDEG_01040 [Edhazardia aedis USNM 41457]|eukprot:EJW04750.1 hypothetical protein EDEG_01040 [Edhazardia aedis USNM 41457]